MKKTLDINEQILGNGLKLISVKRDTELFSLNLGIKVGALLEEKAEKGITHFIEHMLFKGTNKRNNEVLNRELELIGGEYNAYTEYNSTVYTINALNTEISKSIELLSDMVLNSVFDSKEIEKEKSVVISEIGSKKDDLEYLCIQKAIELAFEKSNLKYDTLGKKSDINKLTRSQIIEFYKKYYVPSNSVMIVISNFEHQYIKELVETHFLPWKDKKMLKEKILVEDNIPLIKKTYKRDCEHVNIAYLFTFHGLTYQEELALRILCYKLGESQNSILFRKLREDRGLVYDIYSDIDNSKNIKLIYFYTSVNEENMDEAMDIIEKSFEDIKNKKIKYTKDDIELMKKIFKTSLTSTLEDTIELGDYLLSLVLDERNVSEYENYDKNLEEINVEDIQSIAAKVLCNPTLHIISSKKE
ncbi:pitrilysin family protein [Clostridium sediminicola]|uniref:M16 family metallopeptidase n=1 Tax=Clostridium sediminicola TaxID=3114879 RepID=UPI0031F1F448